MEPKKRARVKLRVLLAAALVALLCALAFARIFAAYEQEALDVAAGISDVYLHEMTQQTINHFTTMVNGWFDQLLAAYGRIGQAAPGKEQLTECIGRERAGGKFSFLALIDENGGCYSGKSTGGLGGILPPPQGRDRAVSVYRGSCSSAAIMLRASVAPLELGGNTIVAVAAGMEAGDLRDIFNINTGNSVVYSSIIGTDGEYIVQVTGEPMSDDGTNIFALFEKYAQFDQGYDLKSLKAQISAGVNVLSAMTISGVHMYIYFAPIPGTSMYVATSMQNGLVDAKVNQLGRFTLQIWLISVVIAALVVYSVSRRSRAGAEPSAQAGKEGEKAIQPRRKNPCGIKRALVADDDMELCRGLVRILEDMGIACRYTDNGFDAVRQVEAALKAAKGYDVCFIDWKMPGIDGLETTRRIIQSAGIHSPAVLITAAYDGSRQENAAKQAGAAGLLTKPVFGHDVAKALERVAREGAAREPKGGNQPGPGE